MGFIAKDTDSPVPTGIGDTCVSDIPKTLDAPRVAPTFHPPSFGVTVLGNSHGFVSLVDPSRNGAHRHGLDNIAIRTMTVDLAGMFPQATAASSLANAASKEACLSKGHASCR